ncbi:TPA: DUF3742 family protein [Pseudomonas putida]|nr:DUF3742 family protein [Pseudomonas putida]HDS1802915.1 DUF3742 family protein [Pseudomonas putida]HDS1808847.1 DUF3742 family protein [Pseudomonas putida]
MNANAHPSIPERFGRWLGRAWRAGARVERRVTAWLVRQGVPRGLAVALLWAAKLTCLGVLLYVAFWLALLLLIVAAVAWRGQQASSEEFELKYPATIEELREMPGYDPNLYNDTAHEMYRDD